MRATGETTWLKGEGLSWTQMALATRVNGCKTYSTGRGEKAGTTRKLFTMEISSRGRKTGKANFSGKMARIMRATLSMVTFKGLASTTLLT